MPILRDYLQENPQTSTSFPFSPPPIFSSLTLDSLRYLRCLWEFQRRYLHCQVSIHRRRVHVECLLNLTQIPCPIIPLLLPIQHPVRRPLHTTSLSLGTKYDALSLPVFLSPQIIGFRSLTRVHRLFPCPRTLTWTLCSFVELFRLIFCLRGCHQRNLVIMYRFRRLDQIFISLVARLTQLLKAKRPISGCHPVDFFSLRIKEDICLFSRKKRLEKNGDSSE